MKKTPLVILILGLVAGGFWYYKTHRPKVEIKVPVTSIVTSDTPVAIGRNVTFGILPLSDRPNGLVSASYEWMIYPPVDDLLLWPDNSHGSFGAGLIPTKYDVTLIATYVFVDADGKVASVKTGRDDRIVTIIDPILPAPPAPIPPTPEPSVIVVPDSPMGLTKFIYEKAKGMPVSQAQALAHNFRDVSDRIARSPINQKIDFITAITTTNAAVLGKNLDKWKPVLSALGDFWNVELQGKLTTPSQWQAACEEVAAGLELIK